VHVEGHHVLTHRASSFVAPEAPFVAPTTTLAAPGEPLTDPTPQAVPQQ
jgi:hypothetical protein